jgi:undecaprenyl diphosphate synthase
MKKHASHIAIVADGSVAWARGRELAPLDGLRAGARATEAAIAAASDLGVHQLSIVGLDGFDGRAPHPAAAELLEAELPGFAPLLRRLGVRLRCAGDPGVLPRSLQQALHATAASTEGNTGMQLTLLCGYRGRRDLARVARQLLDEIARGALPLDALDEDAVEARLATAPLPRPDLIVRTGSTRRLADALTFEGAYAELFFTGAPWPAFSGADLSRALLDYRQRERRFGRTSEQVQTQPGPWSASASEPLPL